MVGGEVIGREQAGIIVRYQGGVTKKQKGGERTVAAHTNLRKCGCIIKSFARWTTDEEYQSASARRGCPYRGEETDCECHHCAMATVTWPEKCREASLGDSATAMVLEAPPGEREAVWACATQAPEQPPPTNSTESDHANSNLNPTSRPQRKSTVRPGKSQPPKQPKKVPSRNTSDPIAVGQSEPIQNGTSATPTTNGTTNTNTNENVQNGEPRSATPSGPSDRLPHHGPKDRRSDIRRPTQGN